MRAGHVLGGVLILIGTYLGVGAIREVGRSELPVIFVLVVLGGSILFTIVGILMYRESSRRLKSRSVGKLPTRGRSSRP